MATTVGTSPVDPDDPAGPHDLDGTLPTGAEALRQRVEQRLRFPLGSWPLNDALGTPSVLGHDATPALAERVIIDAILDEGGAEVTEVEGAEFVIDPGTRALRWSADVKTVYGDLALSGLRLL